MPERSRRVSLRIGVDEQHPMAQFAEGRGEVHGQNRLAHTSLGIGQANDPRQSVQSVHDLRCARQEATRRVRTRLYGRDMAPCLVGLDVSESKARCEAVYPQWVKFP